jgi:hypothetical protein
MLGNVRTKYHRAQRTYPRACSQICMRESKSADLSFGLIEVFSAGLNCFQQQLMLRAPIKSMSPNIAFFSLIRFQRPTILIKNAMVASERGAVVRRMATPC